MARHSTTDGETGVIRPGELLSVEECQRRLRLAYAGWKRLRSAGLQPLIREVGGRGFVLSDDVIAVFARLPGREVTP